MKAFKATILTPDGSVFDGKVTSINIPGVEGEFQVLKNHANLMSSLDIGLAKLKTASSTNLSFSISGGFAEVSKDGVTVLAESAESPEKVNVERAKAAKERAEKRLKDLTMDQVRAEASLKRAINRLKLVGVWE